MTLETIRVGVVGAGANTRELHIPLLAAQRGVEVVAVANRTRASGNKVAREFGIGKVADGWRDIVDDPDIDAVCIGTWPYMHAPVVIASLDANKHVLCEARLAMNSTEARRMLEVSRMHPTLVAQVVPAPMTLSFDRVVCKMIGEGYIGDLITLDARIAIGSRFPQWSSDLHWRHQREYSGNNTMGLGIWYESIMRWIGPARTVSAVGQTVVRHRKDASGRRVAMSIPDHVDVIGEMEQGGQMRLSESAVAGHLPSVDLWICGTEGTIHVTYESREWRLEAGRRGARKLGRVRVPKVKLQGWRVEEEFINAIRGKEQVSHTDFETALKYMEWTDAVSASLRTRRVVHLPLDATLQG